MHLLRSRPPLRMPGLFFLALVVSGINQSGDGSKKKILLVGCAGAGKTTLRRNLEGGSGNTGATLQFEQTVINGDQVIGEVPDAAALTPFVRATVEGAAAASAETRKTQWQKGGQARAPLA